MSQEAQQGQRWWTGVRERSWTWMGRGAATVLQSPASRLCVLGRTLLARRGVGQEENLWAVRLCSRRAGEAESACTSHLPSARAAATQPTAGRVLGTASCLPPLTWEGTGKGTGPVGRGTGKEPGPLLGEGWNRVSLEGQRQDRCEDGHLRAFGFLWFISPLASL